VPECSDRIRLHDVELLKLLELCGTGILVNPTLQARFVAYLTYLFYVKIECQIN